MKTRLFRSFALLLLLACAWTAGAQVRPSFETIPAQPQAGEEFVLRFYGSFPYSPANPTNIQVAVDGRHIEMTFTMPSIGFSVPWAYVAETRLTLPAEGTYTVTSLFRYDGYTELNPLASATITVGPRANPATPQYQGLSGLWWSPDEPGWALAVTQPDSGRLFALWFTYVPLTTAPTTPQPQTPGTWYMVPSGNWATPTEYTGMLYTAVGPPANLAFNPAAVAVNAVGTATIRVLSADRLEFDAHAENGVRKRKTLQRFIF